MKVTSLLLIIAIGAGGLYAYDRFKDDGPSPPTESTKPAMPVAPAASGFDRPWGQQSDASPPVASSSAYKCDGRTHCSQMRSCDEAKYFIRNCPNTQMDGDHDGVPCERQWCN